MKIDNSVLTMIEEKNKVCNEITGVIKNFYKNYPHCRLEFEIETLCANFTTGAKEVSSIIVNAKIIL